FRAALALQWIPAESKIRIIHAGEALSRAMAAEARALGKQETRYRWLGEVPRRRAQHLLARSKLLVLSSRMEGGANVVSEALVASSKWRPVQNQGWLRLPSRDVYKLQEGSQCLSPL